MGVSKAGVARGLVVALAALWLQAQGVAVAADLSGRVVGVLGAYVCDVRLFEGHAGDSFL